MARASEEADEVEDFEVDPFDGKRKPIEKFSNMILFLKEE